MKTTIGYKATDANMMCRGVQFALGEWSPEIKGKLIECKNGYHFCVHPLGVWDYYFGSDVRVFKVECRGVLDKQYQSGEKTKLVCRSVKLIQELKIDNEFRLAMKDLGL